MNAEPSLAPVPDPVKPGAGGVRWTQVLAGFGLGLVGSNGLRFLLIAALGDAIDRSGSLAAALAVFLLPTAILIGAILWAARTGRKGWAIGMAIYAGVGGLLVGGTALFVYVACSNFKI